MRVAMMLANVHGDMADHVTVEVSRDVADRLESRSTAEDLASAIDELLVEVELCSCGRYWPPNDYY